MPETTRPVLTKEVYWQIVALVRTKEPFKQAVYKHLFQNVTLEDAGAEIGVAKQAVYRVKKRILDYFEKFQSIEQTLQSNRPPTIKTVRKK
jgi:predicted DNA-binding protein YlxM (UPF0122 family)